MPSLAYDLFIFSNCLDISMLERLIPTSEALISVTFKESALLPQPDLAGTAEI